MDCQGATWFDYEHHNTMKFVVGISPSGFITFLSSCYGGRVSDRFITKNSGFSDILQRDDVVMADCDFQIQEDLLFQFFKLKVPLSAGTKGQMTKKKYKMQKKLQIYKLTLREQSIG